MGEDLQTVEASAAPPQSPPLPLQPFQRALRRRTFLLVFQKEVIITITSTFPAPSTGGSFWAFPASGGVSFSGKIKGKFLDTERFCILKVFNIDFSSLQVLPRHDLPRHLLHLLHVHSAVGRDDDSLHLAGLHCRLCPLFGGRALWPPSGGQQLYDAGRRGADRAAELSLWWTFFFRRR